MEILIKGRLWKSQNSISLWNPFCSFLRSQIGYRTPSRAILSLSQTYSSFPSLHRCSSSGGRRYNRGAGIKQTNKQHSAMFTWQFIATHQKKQNRKARLRKLNPQSSSQTTRRVWKSHASQRQEFALLWSMTYEHNTCNIQSSGQQNSEISPSIYIQTWLKLFSNTLLNVHNSSLLIQITVKWQPFPIVMPTPTQEFSQKAYLQIKKIKMCYFSFGVQCN